MNPSTKKPFGKIMLVGIGPGSAEHMTARARNAIAEADTVVGYVTYIKLIEDLLEGKDVVKKAMTEELDRATDTLELARAGKKVALISSGDAGVYGMAGPTYEVLFQAGWTPESGIEVEIVPGASALNTCAALVGAPLTHDFCAISLSDLLTPWPVIAKRLDAAAAADFVVALYNPKSGRRTRQIAQAQRLFLRHRHPDTPVAIVKSAYRPKQSIEFTTLAQMNECDIGMLSTVLIGNSHTFVRDGLMVTPRGYANKYDVESGAANGHDKCAAVDETRHARFPLSSSPPEGERDKASLREFHIKNGERAGRSLSTGLQGWLESLHASDESPQQLATRYGLPVEYIVEALAEPLDLDDKGEAAS